MAQLEAQLNKIRPTLFQASALEAHIIVAYGVFNVAVALTLLGVPGTIAFLPYPVWALVFIFLGAWMLSAVFGNKWGSARNSLLAGVLVKTILLIAVIGMGNWVIAVVWGVLTWIQILCYVYFPSGNGHVK